MRFIEVRTAFESEKEAKELAEKLLDMKLIACGQISRIESHYSWKNERFVSNEFLLVVKSRRSLLGALTSEIKKNHSYDLPEITCSEILCSKEFGKWVKENTSRKRRKNGKEKNF